MTEQECAPLIWSLPLPLLLEKVLPHAGSIESLGEVFRVCQRFNLAARSQRFWRAFTLAAYDLENQKVKPAEQKLKVPPSNKDWKWLCMSKRTFMDEKFTGLGSKAEENWTYEGEWSEGKKQGYGVLYYVSGVRYEGDFNDGKKHGKGKLYYSQGDYYEGDFVNDKKTGKGLYIWANGDKYSGDFIEDKTSGYGEFSWADGDIYCGNFLNDTREGRGTYRWTNGDMYEGEYKGGSRTGKGCYFYWNGNKYEGGFKNNLFDGEGCFTEFTGWPISVIWSEGIPYRYMNGQLIVKRSREEMEFLEQHNAPVQSFYGVNVDLLEILNPEIVKAIKAGKCTFSVSGKNNYGQFLFKTRERGERTHGLCIVCATKCAPLNGRKLASCNFVFGGNFICDCGLGFENEFPCHAHAKNNTAD
jgi:hypothetical protein